jgi:hypothetical protein
MSKRGFLPVRWDRLARQEALAKDFSLERFWALEQAEGELRAFLDGREYTPEPFDERRAWAVVSVMRRCASYRGELQA